MKIDLIELLTFNVFVNTTSALIFNMPLGVAALTVFVSIIIGEFKVTGESISKIPCCPVKLVPGTLTICIVFKAL